jgi:fido (protein-threonine AMPylation protein)
MSLPILFSRKEWIFDSDEDPNEILQKVEEFIVAGSHDSSSKKDNYKKLFADRSAAEFVYSSNQMEKTLPPGASKHQTFSCLETIFQTGEHSNSSSFSSWNADGGKNQDEMRAQMFQHCTALHLTSVWSSDPLHRLSANQVCELHRILMLNSTNENGVALEVGEIRKCGAFTLGHIYPDASMTGLQRAIEKYHNSLDQKDHFLISAVILFYEVIQVHPFQDGNGRLCCLLLNYALERAGFPFAVPLTSGHSKARKHYISAIRNAQNRDTGCGNIPQNQLLMDLICLVLKSCYYKIINYEANLARMKS